MDFVGGASFSRRNWGFWARTWRYPCEIIEHGIETRMMKNGDVSNQKWEFSNQKNGVSQPPAQNGEWKLFQKVQVDEC
jgi:hypothetical protein